MKVLRDLKEEEVSTININGMDQWNWMRLRIDGKK